MNPVIFSFSRILMIWFLCDRYVIWKPWKNWWSEVFIQVSLHTVFSSSKLSCDILVIVPSMSNLIYRLTYILVKASFTRSQINQTPFTAVKPMMYLKVYLVITTSNWISFRDVTANLALFNLTLVWVYRSLKRM